MSSLLDAFWIHVVLFAADRNAHGFYMRLVRLSLDTDIIMLLEVSKKLRVQRIDPAPVFNGTRTASADGPQSEV